MRPSAANPGLWQLPTIAYLPVLDAPAPGSPAPSPVPAPERLATRDQASDEGWLLHHLPLALDLGVPSQSGAELWQPQMDWAWESSSGHPQAEPPALALQTLLSGLQGLFATLNPQCWSPSTWRCAAPELSDATLASILQGLESIIVSCPTGVSEAYRFNVREAILGAGLVARPEQIAFVEQAIAALLAEFHPQRTLGSSAPLGGVWPGGTLVIQAGQTSTELGLVCLPKYLHHLSYEDIKLRSVPYGEYAFEQDLACQLLYPFIPEDQLDLKLSLVPLPGEPDVAVRSQLQRQLYRSPLGQMLLEASSYLYQVLQRQERLTFEFGPHTCTFSRTALDTKVIQPYVLRLNRELNRLLTSAGLITDEISQVVLAGDGATVPVIRQWLQQKLPHAKLISEQEDPETLAAELASPLPLQSPLAAPFLGDRLAYGLVTLALYPQVLDRNRQQYNDYFLLLELLRTLPDQPLPLADIFKRLEVRGVNTQVCGDRLLSVLNGELPVGLVPEPMEAWTAASREHEVYAALRSRPLFMQIQPQVYQPDAEQRQRLWQYWQQIAAQSRQNLEEPYILQVGLSVAAAWG